MKRIATIAITREDMQYVEYHLRNVEKYTNWGTEAKKVGDLKTAIYWWKTALESKLSARMWSNLLGTNECRKMRDWLHF